MDEIAMLLAEARAETRGRMRARCKIERPNGSTEDGKGGAVPILDPIPNPYDDQHGTPCWLRYPGLAFETNSDSAGVAVTQSRIVLRAPFGAVYRPGDRVTILSDPDNPQLAGTVLRVASIDDMSQATAQRLLCEDNQAGV